MIYQGSMKDLSVNTLKSQLVHWYSIEAVIGN